MKAIIVIIFIFSLIDENLNLNRAKQLIANQEYAQAIVLLHQIEDVRAQYYLGWCYLKTNNCANANIHFDKFINEYSANDLWVEEAKKNKINCSGSPYIVATNQDNGKDLKVKHDYKKLNDDYQLAMTSYQKKDTILELKPFDFSTVTPITNFKRVKKEVIRNSYKNTSIVSEKPSVKVTNQTPNQNPPSTINTNPISDIVTKTDITPITPKRNSNLSTPPVSSTKPITDIPNKTNREPEEKLDITVSEKKHHYKILFTIENQPDKTFMSIVNIGPVTYEKANGENYIYYIGFFQSEEKAIEAREQVKAAGYKMARVMEFNKGALEKEFKEEMEQPTIAEVLDKKTNIESKPIEISETPKAVEPKQPEKQKEQIQEVIKSDVVSYHILFRVLDNPYEKFDNLKQFGPLYRETFDTKGNSRYLIGNTDDINVAKQLLEKVKKVGYPASFVAEYMNGQLSKIIQE